MNSADIWKTCIEGSTGFCLLKEWLQSAEDSGDLPGRLVSIGKLIIYGILDEKWDVPGLCWEHVSTKCSSVDELYSFGGIIELLEMYTSVRCGQIITLTDHGEPEGGVRWMLGRGANPAIGMCQNPINYASLWSLNKCLSALVDAGVDVNTADPYDECLTPLAYAVLANNIDGARYLLSKGADTGAVDESGYTIIESARKSGNMEMYKMLTSHR